VSAWDYGNARVRAARSRLLDRRRYRDLLRSSDLASLLGALASTDYRVDVEAALARAPDLQRLDEVLRRHGTRVLRALRSWYDGEARTEVDRDLAWWDWRNLRVIVLALTRRVSPAAIEPLLVPAGSLDAAALDTLARQPGLGPAVDLMQAWGLPVRGLRGDAPLDALDRLWAHRLGARAVDRLNVLLALRLGAERSGERTRSEGRFLPGGTLDPESLDAAARAATRGDAAARLPAPWPARLQRYVHDGDLGALSDDLEIADWRDAVRGSIREDPLGPAIPRAYVAAKRIELRNLRRIARGLEAGWPRLEIEEGLVVP